MSRNRFLCSVHILYASGKFENSITGILVYHFDYLGSTRKITDKAGKINYNDPFGLSPRHILAPYANVAHDILNIASIVPGPVGAIAGVTNAMVYLLMGDRVNACKCIIQAALTGAALPIAGIAIGGLCNLNTTARLVTAFTLIGAGAYTVGTSFVDFCSYYEKLSAEIAKGENANGADIFHYISGLIQSGAGMVYGGLSIAGGASGLMNQCFVEGTEVATDDGLKNIEDIEEGDVVWSCNPDTGETGLKSVKQVFVNETDELVHVTITVDTEGKVTNYKLNKLGEITGPWPE